MSGYTRKMDVLDKNIFHKKEGESPLYDLWY